MSDTDKQCLICFDSENVQKFSCGDHYCTECIKSSIEIQVESKNIDLKCPTCEQPFNSYDLQSAIGLEQCEKLYQTKLNINQIDFLSEDDKMIDCVGLNCSNKVVVWKKAEYYTCPQCNDKYCLLCKKPFHEGLTCKQALMYQNPEEIKEYSEMQKLGLKKCPHCLVLIEKNEDGCFFIRCRSQVCQSQNYFCFRCEEKLKEEDHWAHYENDNPFLGNCLVRNEQGKWVKDDEQKQQTQNHPNDFPCPKCGTYDAKQCKKQENFKDILCECNSNTCKGSYYCMICKGKVDMVKYQKHFNENFECIARKCEIF